MSRVDSTWITWHAKEQKKTPLPIKQFYKAKKKFLLKDRKKTEDEPIATKPRVNSANENLNKIVKYEYNKQSSYILLKGYIKCVDANCKVVCVLFFVFTHFF